MESKTNAPNSDDPQIRQCSCTLNPNARIVYYCTIIKNSHFKNKTPKHVFAFKSFSRKKSHYKSWQYKCIQILSYTKCRSFKSQTAPIKSNNIFITEILISKKSETCLAKNLETKISKKTKPSISAISSKVALFKGIT